MTRLVHRIEKLLRVAAPSSGASLSERTTAALEVARLFEENDLTVREQLKAREQPRRGHANHVPAARTWAPSVAARDGLCITCEKTIRRGDAVHTRIVGFNPEYRHNHCNITKQ